MAERGKFIVFEGLDRSGKSTCSRSLTEKLSLKQPTKQICFPNRTSPIGKLINEYLTNKRKDLHPNVLHLLFSANRWEYESEIKKMLEEGTNIIRDRYFHSGIAYSFANGIDLQWAKQPDNGLLEPDLIIYLEGNPQVLAQRSGYGEEAFQNVQFQRKVKYAFDELFKTTQIVSRINVQTLSLEDCINETERIVNDKFGAIL